MLAGSGERVRLYGNAIHDNKDVGVLVTQEGVVSVKDNSITSNKVGVRWWCVWACVRCVCVCVEWRVFKMQQMWLFRNRSNSVGKEK